MVLRTFLRAVMIALAATLAGMIGVMIGIFGTSITMAIGLRSLFTIVCLLALTRLFRVRDRKAVDQGLRPPWHVLVAAGAAGVVSIPGWGGHALFGQLLVPSGVFEVLIDFFAWMVVAAAGVYYLGDRARVECVTTPAPGQVRA